MELSNTKEKNTIIFYTKIYKENQIRLFMAEKEVKKGNGMKFFVKNIWAIATIVLAIVLVVVLFSGREPTISANAVGQKVIDFANAQGANAQLVSVEEEGDLFKVTLSISNEEFPVYVTRDGENLITSLIPLNSTTTDNSDSTDTSDNSGSSVVKSDKPVVELFVMSYCPYGTQAEKGLIPVVKLLGDKIDFRIRYVYYAMHPSAGEVQENLREYCIQETAEDKFISYMECFLEGNGVKAANGYITAGNDPDTCIAKAGIDTTALDKCIADTDKAYSVTSNLEDKSTWLSGSYPKFDVEANLNEQYGISGSPTLVINGKQVSSARDSASLLKVVCSAFNEVPEECDETLSSTSPSVYFGWGATGSSTNASCG